MRDTRALFIEAVQAAQAMLRAQGDRSRVENRGIYPLDALIVCWHLHATGDKNPLIDFDASKKNYDRQDVVRMYRRDLGRALVNLLEECCVPQRVWPNKLSKLAKSPRQSAWKQRYDLGALLNALKK